MFGVQRRPGPQAAQAQVKPKRQMPQPWVAANKSFKDWYREKLQQEFTYILNIVGLVQDMIKGKSTDTPTYGGFILDLQEAQLRIGQLLLELDPDDTILALQLNELLCFVLEWAKGGGANMVQGNAPRVDKLLPQVEAMLKPKGKSNDDMKVSEQPVVPQGPRNITIKVQLGVGQGAKFTTKTLPEGSNASALARACAQETGFMQLAFVRDAKKMTPDVVLNDGDSIICVISSTPLQMMAPAEASTNAMIPTLPSPQQPAKSKMAPVANPAPASNEPLDFLSGSPMESPAAKPAEANKSFDPLEFLVQEEPKKVESVPQTFARLDLDSPEAKPAAPAEPESMQFVGFGGPPASSNPFEDPAPAQPVSIDPEPVKAEAAPKAAEPKPAPKADASFPGTTAPSVPAADPKSEKPTSEAQKEAFPMFDGFA